MTLFLLLTLRSLTAVARLLLRPLIIPTLRPSPVLVPVWSMSNQKSNSPSLAQRLKKVQKNVPRPLTEEELQQITCSEQLADRLVAWGSKINMSYNEAWEKEPDWVSRTISHYKTETMNADQRQFFKYVELKVTEAEQQTEVSKAQDLPTEDWVKVKGSSSSTNHPFPAADCKEEMKVKEQLETRMENVEGVLNQVLQFLQQLQIKQEQCANVSLG